MTDEVNLKAINRLAIPSIIAGISEPIITIADSAVVGHMSAASLGAVGVGTSFFMLLVWVLAAFKHAISAIISRYYGQEKTEETAILIPQTLVLAVLSGLILFAGTSLFAREIFKFYQASGDVLEKTISYYSIRAAALPFTLATLVIYGVFRGYQNTSRAMRISLIGGAVNLILDFILVYGWFPGLSPLDVQGAAIASVASQVLVFGLALECLIRKTGIKLYIPKQLHPEFKAMGGMIFNLIIRTFALNIALYLGNRFANIYGEDYIAAHTMAINIWLFSAFFIDGYAEAGNAIAGKLFGKKGYQEIYRLGNKLIRIDIMIAAGLGLVYLLGYPFIGKIFSGDDKVLNIFNNIFWIVIISQPINSVAFTLDGIFKGLGQAAFLRNNLLIATLAGFIPVIFTGHALGWEMYAIWAAFTAWMVLRSLMMYLRFRRMYAVVPQH